MAHTGALVSEKWCIEHLANGDDRGSRYNEPDGDQVSFTDKEGNEMAAPPRTMAEDSVLSRFVEWFEREDIGATFDAFIADHASSFLGASAATEQRLEWTHLYNEYVALFDAKLQSFLEGAGTTQEAFLAEASTAEGLHDAYLQIFLAHAEYDTFIDLMAEQAEKQQS